MSGINFKGVETAKGSVMTRPGTIDVVEVKEVKFDSSKNTGSYYMGLTLARKQDSFSHSFFLSEKALKRLKSFVKAVTGKELEEELSEAQLTALLSGRKVGMKVTAKKDDKNGRWYPDLSFVAWVPAEEVETLAFSDDELSKNKAADDARANSKIEDADGPTAAPSTGTVPAAAPVAAADENPF